MSSGSELPFRLWLCCFGALFGVHMWQHGDPILGWIWIGCSLIWAASAMVGWVNDIRKLP